MTVVQVRPAIEADREFVLTLVPRLRAFGEVPFRPADVHDRAERDTLERAMSAPSAESVVLVAEIAEQGLVGVALAETATDYFTKERHGYLAILAVSERAEGHGVGSALLTATEAWARTRGYRFLTLNVFAANARARAVYERAGFAPDTIRYAKVLA